MRRMAAIILVLACGGSNGACDSLYYKAMKKVGYEKRDILLKRIREARKSQVEAQEDVKSALERFQAVVDTGHGGALQDRYEELSKALERAEGRATAVHDRVQQVREVSKDLFNEWEDELKKYSDRVLFLKHNLNAKVLGGLAGELKTIQSDVDALLVDLQASIAEADGFIKTMEAAQASANAR